MTRTPPTNGSRRRVRAAMPTRNFSPSAWSAANRTFPPSCSRPRACSTTWETFSVTTRPRRFPKRRTSTTSACRSFNASASPSATSPTTTSRHRNTPCRCIDFGQRKRRRKSCIFCAAENNIDTLRRHRNCAAIIKEYFSFSKSNSFFRKTVVCVFATKERS